MSNSETYYKLPLEYDNTTPYTPHSPTNTVLVLGSSSEMSRTLAPALSQSRTLIGMDVDPVDVHGYSEIVSANINDKEKLTEYMERADVVINLTTGVKSGWKGLVNAEIEGTKTILEASINSGVRRLIHMSSLHTQGLNERKWLKGQEHKQLKLDMHPEVDGLYGAAKSFAEIIVTYASETTGLPVSILKVGTFRHATSLEELIVSKTELWYLGDGDKRRSRLERTWLSKRDLVRAVVAEIERKERYYLNYLTSSPDQAEYVHEAIVRR